jgi:hypothetical protein
VPPVDAELWGVAADDMRVDVELPALAGKR